MEINGREVDFIFNVLASIEVAKICPDGKLENIDKLFGGGYEADITATSKFIIALHKGYIATKKIQDPNYDAKLLTEEELLLLDTAEYLDVQNAAMKAYEKGNKRNVQTAPKGGKGKKTVNPKK